MHCRDSSKTVKKKIIVKPTSPYICDCFVVVVKVHNKKLSNSLITFKFLENVAEAKLHLEITAMKDWKVVLGINQIVKHCEVTNSCPETKFS